MFLKGFVVMTTAAASCIKWGFSGLFYVSALCFCIALNASNTEPTVKKAFWNNPPTHFKKRKKKKEKKITLMEQMNYFVCSSYSNPKRFFVFLKEQRESNCALWENDKWLIKRRVAPPRANASCCTRDNSSAPEQHLLTRFRPSLKGQRTATHVSTGQKAPDTDPATIKKPRCAEIDFSTT